MKRIYPEGIEGGKKPLNREDLEIALAKEINKDFARLVVPIAEEVMELKMPFAKYHLVSNEEFLEEFDLKWSEYVSQN